MSESRRNKLYDAFDKKVAALVERYYDEAITAAGEATNAMQAQMAVEDFKRNLDAVKIIDGVKTEDVSLGGVYALLIIAVIFSAGALALSILMFLKKRNDFTL